MFGLEENTTEDIWDDRDVIKRNLNQMSQVLAGKRPGCIEAELLPVGIIEALSKFHRLSGREVQDIYEIRMIYDGAWTVIVGQKEERNEHGN